MSTRRFAAAVCSLVIIASAALEAWAVPVLNVIYNPESGNVSVQNTTSGSVAVQSINVLTLGNGTAGDPSGRPGNIGWLSEATATVPSAAFVTLNDSAFGINGIYSQVFAANVGSAFITLAPFSAYDDAKPSRGPAGSYIDLGNIAPTGMTQAMLNTRFITDPELTPPNFDTPAYGQFLFTYQTSPGNYSSGTFGDVRAQVVPEPSTYAMLISAVVCGGWMVRRRKTA